MARIGFQTDRLIVEDWGTALRDPTRRKALERDLAAMLEPAVTRHLPRSMDFPGPYGQISGWVNACDADARVMTIRMRDDQRLAGLILLADDSHAPTEAHLGYFLGTLFWGHGIGSEMVAGLLTALALTPFVMIYAGVDRDNPASARVLEKAGFSLSPGHTNEDRLFFEFHLK